MNERGACQADGALAVPTSAGAGPSIFSLEGELAVIELTAAEKRQQGVLQRLAALWTPDRSPEDSCISYRPLWNQAEGLSTDTPYTMTNPHATMLFHIGVFEAERGRPMLTSLVVNNETRWAGPGFIHRLAVKIGHPDIPDEEDEVGMRKFWSNRLRETVEYWSAPAAVVAVTAIDAAETRLRAELSALDPGLWTPETLVS